MLINPHPILKPQRLKPGDTLAIVSPAAPSPPEAFETGQQLLSELGFKTKIFPHARDWDAYLAGSDEGRLSDLLAAFSDPEINGIICARGGYGSMRLLNGIDFERIRHNPKVFVGFSDITALHVANWQQAGLIGFYGPMMTSNLIKPEESWSKDELFRFLTAPFEPPYAIPNRDAYQCFHPGVSQGYLMGGNLSLLAALCGTPYQPITEGAILFIEDWKESYYSLDRQFQQLQMAGLFNGIAGLLLCDFSQISADNAPYDLPTQLRRLTQTIDAPVGYGFSIGHGPVTATLPIGCQARFDAEAGTLTLLEAPFCD
jgi:muramoyltetrapeptide carboxypeptidase